MSFVDHLSVITRWLQKKDDELLYEPDVDLGTDLCPCDHCRQFRDEIEPWDIPLPGLEVISFEVSTVGIEGQSFGEACLYSYYRTMEELARGINARYGRA